MRTLLMVGVLALVTFAGCLNDDDTTDAATGSAGGDDPALMPALDLAWRLGDVGARGPEPTLGVTSDGAIFFQALEDTMKSLDGGVTWSKVSTTLAAPTTLDPMLWVDTVTDRVFSNQLYLGCSYLSWTDDGGSTWTTNPVACGTPVNDHQKVATGAFVPGSPLANAATYPNVVYYAFNGLADSRVAISIDGGLTFPYTSESNPAVDGTEGAGNCRAGLHGHITAAPDGTVYVPGRSSCAYEGPMDVEGGYGGPWLARSTDNAMTWTTRTLFDDIGTADHDKNPEVAVGRDNTVYMTWPGADNRLYYAWSMDAGDSWSNATLVAPATGTATFPVIQAGDAGRVAVAWYGIDNATNTAAPDLVEEDTRWSLFAAVTLNGHDAEPTWTITKVTGDDPIQIGPISTNSGDAPSGSRNLLDFIDMVVDRNGRPHVAWADGCTGDCASNPDAEMTDSRDAAGMVAIMDHGPSLYEDVGDLE